MIDKPYTVKDEILDQGLDPEKVSAWALELAGLGWRRIFQEESSVAGLSEKERGYRFRELRYVLQLLDTAVDGAELAQEEQDTEQ